MTSERRRRDMAAMERAAHGTHGPGPWRGRVLAAMAGAWLGAMARAGAPGAAPAAEAREAAQTSRETSQSCLRDSAGGSGAARSSACTGRHTRYCPAGSERSLTPLLMNLAGHFIIHYYLTLSKRF